MIKLREKGFTLVEIMIVVAVIAIISAIAIPNFMAARSRSRANACKANLRQIDSAVEEAAMDYGLTDGRSVSFANLVPNYIKRTPICPAGGTYGSTGPWRVTLPALGFIASSFEVGSTPWCSIGSGPAARGCPHIMYQ